MKNKRGLVGGMLIVSNSVLKLLRLMWWDLEQIKTNGNRVIVHALPLVIPFLLDPLWMNGTVIVAVKPVYYYLPGTCFREWICFKHILILQTT